jgi:hypothetical protein
LKGDVPRPDSEREMHGAVSYKHSRVKDMIGRGSFMIGWRRDMIAQADDMIG